MSQYQAIKAATNAYIKTNGRQEITGNILNSILNAIIDSLGRFFQFVDIAKPTDDPGEPDQNVVYFAGTAGTYANFGGIVVNSWEIAVLKYDGEWTKEVVYQIPSDLSAYTNDVGFVTQDTLGINNDDLVNDPAKGIQFADRVNGVNTNGKNYVILRTDKTFAEQVTESDTIYEIRYAFDLGGGSVTFPSGCTLLFNGGRLSNGSLVYDKTEIKGEPFIRCTCTGQLQNDIVTPQMYGAVVDGVTDDNVALNNAAKYNDCLFLPAGNYCTSEPITMHSNMTLYGVGRESKIINNVVNGYNKVCIFTGGMQVGTNTGSFLNLTPYSCTISSDRMSVLVADTSPFKVGDLVFVCKDETYSTKNPPHYWNGKIVEIVENTSIKLDAYIDNDDLVGVACFVRDLAVLPQGGGHFPDVLTENICIHDLSVINSVDDGSGMYVMSIGSYGAEIYNIWGHGNTIIGSNYLVNATLRNIVADFDGGFADIPEINQNVEMCFCRAKRFGSRVNILGLTFLQGYKAFVHDNNIDMGGNGKVGFGQHIRPIIKNNVFSNLMPSSGRPIELSSFGECVFSGNWVSSPTTTSIVNLTGGNGHIVTDNYFVNPNVVRWIEAYNTLDFALNVFRNNYMTNQVTSDAQFYNLPDTRIETFIPRVNELGTRTIAAGATYTSFSNPKLICNARAVKVTLLLSRGDYSVKFTSSASSSNTRTIALTNATRLEVYIFATSNYINYSKDGDDAGAGRAAFNSHGRLTAIDITNNGATDASLYVQMIECLVP